MTSDGHQKVTADHLRRDAYLYVRQSTLRQVVENTESTKRQYGLREQAVRLGWRSEQITVIDDDLGRSGASADRDGFQRLVTAVSMGRAGIVLGLEVSRLARNNVDWHRLLEICALTETLILDEDGLYDPRHFNDRLLLGLKGTFSEAELHVLRARLQGGIQAKARRGDLKKPLPVGLSYDEQDRVVRDPDRQVQQALHNFFATYDRTGAASATVKEFARQGLLFPRRLRHGLRKGQLVWGNLTHSRACQILKNPWYAGAYVHGRTKVRMKANGKLDFHRLPQDQWDTVLPEHHPGYITWEQFLHNQQQLRECARAHGHDRRKSPPREGPALLQGLVICGRCGQRMTVRYHTRFGELRPQYVCQRHGIEQGERICQSIPGGSIDREIGQLLLELVEPMTLNVALAVQKELEGRLEEADRLRRQQVERARYAADLARERYLAVDPHHRLVADTLEADWNDKLLALDQMQQEYDHQREADRIVMDEAAQKKVRSLATSFPELWRDPQTPQRERKRMIRLLIEDVTLTKDEQITLGVRLRGGAVQTRSLPLPPPSWKTWQTDPAVVGLIDELLDDYTDREIASKLSERGLRSGKGARFTPALVARVRQSYRLRSRFDRLRDAGLRTLDEMADGLGVGTCTVKAWAQCGLLHAVRYNDKKQCLYGLIAGRIPVKQPGFERSDPRRFRNQSSNATEEV